MQYTAKEIVIREKITTEYHVDGVTYPANITPHGRGGMAELMSRLNNKAIIEIEKVGGVRVTFPLHEKILVRERMESIPKRFTHYAKEELKKAAEILVEINSMASKEGYTADWLDLEVLT